MASLTQIRSALSSTITGAVSGIQGYPSVPEVANLPAFVVIPRASDFQRAMGRGLDAYTFDVIVLVSRRDDLLAQADLDEYINGFGTKSIRAAIWGTRDLGIGVDATVTGMSDYGAQFAVGDLDHVGARLNVEVLSSGTA